MRYGALINNKLVYAEEHCFYDKKGELVTDYDKNEELLFSYGFKPIIENIPEYNEVTDELYIENIVEEQYRIKINYGAKTINLEPIKLGKITKTKNDLALYLFNNPIFSKCHYAEGAYYAVTSEKQAQLTQLLTSYILDVQLGIVTELHWNSTGNMCEVYTFEELTQLRREMFAFVLPMVSLQQYIEVLIKNAVTLSELQAIDTTINYERAIQLAQQNNQTNQE